MSQVWHLFRNDLQASKYILIVWFGAFAAYMAFSLQDPLTSDWRIYGSVISMLTPVVAIVCAALLVQQDSLIGVRPFWRTRPISRWTLLASKALFVALMFIGSQLTLCCMILLRFGLPPTKLPAVLAEGAWQWTAHLAIGIALATLTSGSAQFITATWLTYLTAAIVLAMKAHYEQGNSIDDTALSCAMLGLGGVIVLLRYGGVSRLKTAAVAAGCGVAIIALAGAGRLDVANRIQQTVQSIERESWGSTELQPGNTVTHEDYAVRVMSLTERPQPSTIVLRERRLMRLNGGTTWPLVRVVAGDAGDELWPVSKIGSLGSVERRGWVGGWPHLDVQERTLEYDMSRPGRPVSLEAAKVIVKSSGR